MFEHIKQYVHLQAPFLTVLFFPQNCSPPGSFLYPAHANLVIDNQNYSQDPHKAKRRTNEKTMSNLSNSVSFSTALCARVLMSSSSSRIRTSLASFASIKAVFSWASNALNAFSS